ncbi:hypothetical protein A2837_02795 [Candidatus Kaiserbacteria bacterium RIFCSPHIGHO2_01_FULL_46_22]|uniref:Bacterial type II secretion system protein E domain-containing protein n=1 Tax=Candidatus Kaiserbacteria bacterium RIFCSPHIGHO2_01_FULL_46_22 TaxID=1798475 RepID=A0A1F6BWT2_9BACT|nr:MAG: hypothetical protein A2837_02795 [Candidatus Kaiserbacteria bacterium RIFCSPHIGHO2_01_FULL_46_22]
MSAIEDSQLHRFISSAGLVTKKDLMAAEQMATSSGRSLGEALLSMGYLNEDDMRRVEAYILGIPFVTLDPHSIDFSVLSLIPEPIARDHNIVAFKRTDGTLEVALLSIADLSAVEFVGKKNGLRLLPRLTSTESIRGALLQYQKTLKNQFGDVIAGAVKEFSNEYSNTEITDAVLLKLGNAPSSARIVDALLRHALIQEATDVHIEAPEREILIRYRIDGILRNSLTLPRYVDAALISRLKTLARIDPVNRRGPQEGRFKMEIDGQKISVRVSTLPVFQGEKVTLRLVRENRSGFTLEGIGFHGLPLERVYTALRQKSGLILIGGPAGSGRTTTLYTLLDLLNTPSLSLATIENPIEYQMPRISQTEVREDVGLTYSAGLRAMLRSDADVVAIGEISDIETARLAVQAAETGTLVLATVNASSAADAVKKLLSLAVDPARLANAFTLAIGQRLCRALTNEKEPYTLKTTDREELSQKADLDLVMMHLKEEGILNGAATWTSVPFYQPKPDVVEDEAYQGRFALHEIMSNSKAVLAAIESNGSAADILTVARREGMPTLFEDGLYKAARGATSIEEVKRIFEM